MLDMGFEEAINDVIAQVPNHRQTLLFSATYPDSIKEMSRDFQYKPVEVSIDVTHSHDHIEQHFYEVDQSRRDDALARLLRHFSPESSVVFCNTKRECQEVADELREHGFYALAIHGDLEQRERDQVLVRFANKSCSILVATDVAARGLDIKDLEAVINYELSRDPEVHVHRIGRTGRAGKRGLALNLCTPYEVKRAIAIEEYQNAPVIWENIDELSEVEYAKSLPPMVTLCIDGGRKAKIRPGDILGALTGDGGIAGSEIGKIDIFDRHAYVAVKRISAKKALKSISQGKIKGRRFKVRRF